MSLPVQSACRKIKLNFVPSRPFGEAEIKTENKRQPASVLWAIRRLRWTENYFITAQSAMSIKGVSSISACVEVTWVLVQGCSDLGHTKPAMAIHAELLFLSRDHLIMGKREILGTY